MGIGHGFQRGEGFGGDDEQGLGGIEIAHGLGKVGAVDIGDKAEDHGAVAVVLERFIGHHRAQVGASDADVDHVANALAGMALPLPAANAVGKGGHLIEHRVHAGHHVFAIDHDGLALGRAQGDVQHGALFGDVDLLPAKHGVATLFQSGFFGQLEEQFGVSSVMRFLE